MEDFLDSLLPFLIITVFVGSRIVFAIRRNRDRRGSGKSAPARAAPPKAAQGFVPWEDEFRDDAFPKNAVPVRTAPVGEDEDFSAWNLSVDDDPPSTRLPDAPGPGPLIAAGLSRFQDAPEPDPLAAPAYSNPPRPDRRFRRLSPLQQGVVWAEILGAPKGFKG
jgi:hypothetical protein